MTNLKTIHMVAIDPLAVILPNEIYAKLKAPRPMTDVAETMAQVAKLSPEDKMAVLKNARDHLAYTQAVIEAAAGKKESR